MYKHVQVIWPMMRSLHDGQAIRPGKARELRLGSQQRARSHARLPHDPAALQDVDLAAELTAEVAQQLAS